MSFSIQKSALLYATAQLLIVSKITNRARNSFVCETSEYEVVKSIQFKDMQHYVPNLNTNCVCRNLDAI